LLSAPALVDLLAELGFRLDVVEELDRILERHPLEIGKRDLAGGDEGEERRELCRLLVQV